MKYWTPDQTMFLCILSTDQAGFSNFCTSYISFLCVGDLSTFYVTNFAIYVNNVFWRRWGNNSDTIYFSSSDEKEKYDPTGFRDAVVQGLNEAGTDLEQVSKFLDKAGSQLDYRRYAETLLDILFAGGILGESNNEILWL